MGTLKGLLNNPNIPFHTYSTHKMLTGQFFRCMFYVAQIMFVQILSFYFNRLLVFFDHLSIALTLYACIVNIQFYQKYLAFILP